MTDLLHKPTIIGDRVILRPFEPGDIPYMEQCLRDPEVIRLTGSDEVYDSEVIVRWYSTRNEQADRLDLAIVDRSADVVVGEVVVNEHDPVKHSMNYRILIGPRGRNRGLGTEATLLIRDYMFQNTDLKQLTLSVFAFNPRAQRVYEKTGFVLESVEEGALEDDGKLIDSYNMVLTRERWEKLKEAGGV
ncbi:acetyltransferase [Insulibacter thermoxylanivorax]|uniref:Acetyltransferase n=1 Tax=Insulibacter thermoxylanivorax TaxID=2749268 RepID=A0A916VIE2_9BACL|nr:GNAT family protein [Insulibacter thermoxylanivorax]GFR39215.1 acetyltransferase [Insulibacter thermoxylanivorax]